MMRIGEVDGEIRRRVDEGKQSILFPLPSSLHGSLGPSRMAVFIPDGQGFPSNMSLYFTLLMPRGVRTSKERKEGGERVREKDKSVGSRAPLQILLVHI